MPGGDKNHQKQKTLPQSSTNRGEPAGDDEPGGRGEQILYCKAEATLYVAESPVFSIRAVIL